MNIIPTKLDGVVIIETQRFGDDRGYFKETFQAERYAKAGIHTPFVQDNFSHSSRGVLRGLHYQITNPQGKLVSVLSGEVYDVAVDLRIDSPTFAEWVGSFTDRRKWSAIVCSAGFGHGFCVVSETADFFYKCTDYYCPASERAVLWNDPDLAIEWPIDSPNVSEKDAKASPLKSAELFGLHNLIQPSKDERIRLNSPV